MKFDNDTKQAQESPLSANVPGTRHRLILLELKNSLAQYKWSGLWSKLQVL